MFKGDRFAIGMLRVLPTTPNGSVRKYLTDAMRGFESDPADTPFQRGYVAAIRTVHADCFMTGEERTAEHQRTIEASFGTAGTLGQIAPLSQSNSQSSECVDGDVGTAGTGTPAVGTRITASRVIIVTMLALAALALIAKLGGGFR
jgi:hypothetical protein